MPERISGTRDYPPWSFPPPVGYWSVSLAVLLGLCWPLGFAPFGFTPLPILLLAALFALTSRHGPKAAFWHAYLFGLAGFAAGLYWISHTLHTYGFLPWPLAIVLMLLLAAVMAFYPAIAVGLARLIFPNRTLAFLVGMPLLWVLLDWLRGHLFTGFPWLSLGYSQTLAPLGGLAPWVGVYGIGLVAAWMAGLLAWSWAEETRRALWLIGFPTVLVIMGLTQLMGQAELTRPVDSPLKVRLLQGNIPQAVKWSPEAVEPTLRTYVNLLLQTPPGTDLVVLPESAIPLFRDEVPALLRGLALWSQRQGTAIILGIDERVPRGNGVDYYNSALAITGQRPIQSYHKRHLVPFGEYVPLRPWIGGVVNQLVPGQGDFSKGTSVGVLRLAGQSTGTSICYEAAFGDEIRSDVRAGARFLLNISNDDWFGDTIAPHQHLQMAQMRARESQRPLVRATNTGITVFIGPDGRIQSRLPQFQTGALNGALQPRTGLTPYARFGDWPVLLLAGFGLLSGWTWQWRQQRLAPAPEFS